MLKYFTKLPTFLAFLTLFPSINKLDAGCSSCARGALKCTDCFDSRCGYVNDYCFDGWKIYADYLYWRVSRPSLDFAIEKKSIDEQSIFSVEPERSSGFRLGWENAMPSFSIGILYTHFNNQASRQVFIEDLYATRDVLTSLNSDYITTYLPPASANYRLELDHVDFLLSKLCQNHTLNYSVIPYVGIRIGKLNQSFKIKYIEEMEVETPIASSSVDIEEKSSTNFCGLIAGFNANWIFCGANTVFLECSLGSLAAEATQKSKKYISFFDELTPLTPEERILETQIKGSECSMIFTTEMRAGLDFAMGRFFGGYISLQIGYEFNNWYKLTDFLEALQNNFTSYSNIYIEESKTNIQIDGLFVRLNADF